MLSKVLDAVVEVVEVAVVDVVLVDVSATIVVVDCSGVVIS